MGDIDGDGTSDVTLDGNGSSRVLLVSGDAQAVVNGVTVTGGNSYVGGGIRINSSADLTLVNSAIVANSASYFGGAIYNSGTTTLENTMVSDNYSERTGGGIYNKGTLALSDTTVSNNTALWDGGGLFNQGYSTATLVDTTVSDNQSQEDGGGIANIGTLTLTNTTLSGNDAAARGGGLFSSVEATLINTTVSGNTASNTGGVRIQSGTATLTNSLVLGNSGGEISGSYTDSLGNLIGNGTIDVADVFANTIVLGDGATEAGLLADNGGPVKTIALKADADNPALDRGDSIAEGTDANGNQRDVDIAGLYNGGTVDAGAFELQIDELEAPSLVVTTTEDVVNALDGLTSLREAVAYAEELQGADTITFDEDVFGGGGTIYLGDNGQLELTSDITVIGDVDGDGTSDVTLDASGSSRVLLVSGGRAAIDGLTIVGGYADQGGGIQINSGAYLSVDNSTVAGNHATDGGGIWNRGTLTLTNSTVSDNTAEFGGGILNEFAGAATLVSATITGNYATDDRSFTTGDGGGVLNRGSLSMINSTVSGNDGTFGGGLYNDALAIAHLINTTFTGNDAFLNGGGLAVKGELTLTNSLVLGNSGGQIDTLTGYTNGGGNLVGDGTIAVEDVFAEVDPVTGGGLLADNGGLVETIALKADADNPALDRGAAISESVDANGNQRNIDLYDLNGVDVYNDGTVDAGAVELQSLPEASSLVVTTTEDVVDAFDGETSLREALAYADSVADADGDGESNDTITFAAGIGEAFENGGTINLGGSQLQITSDVTIDGDVDGDGDADVTLDAGGASRVVLVSGGSDATLADLIVTGGNAANGGGIHVNPGAVLTIENSSIVGNNASQWGGGINSRGDLTLIDTMVYDNSARQGGAISAIYGTVTLMSSTLSGNSATKYGGGLYNYDAAVSLVNTTIAANTASYGGGIYNLGSVSLANSTVTGNTATDGGGIMQHGYFSVSNSMILGNSGGEISDAYTESGSNLVGDGAIDAADVFASTIVLADGTVAGVLADNGGPVETVALKADVANPALDTASTDNGGTIEATDARGEDAYDAPAIDNGSGNTDGRDIGAYELVNEAPQIIDTSGGQIQFSDADTDDTHSVDVTDVAITGDEALLGGADAFVFLTLDQVDQNADTADWTFDLPQSVIDNLASGLSGDETLTLEYTVDVTDQLGAGDQTSISFTLDHDGLLV